MHSRSQENTWTELTNGLDGKFGSNYAVRRTGDHHLTISDLETPNREIVLNFAGTDLYVHYSDVGSITVPIRVNEDGSF